MQLKKRNAFLIRAFLYLMIFQNEFIYIYISSSTNYAPIKFLVLKHNLAEVILFTINFVLHRITFVKLKD